MTKSRRQHKKFSLIFFILEDFLKSEKETVSEYCKALVNVTFVGETSNHKNSKNTDTSNIPSKYHLGLFLLLAHTYIQSFKNVEEFTGREEMYVLLLKLIFVTRTKKENRVEKFEKFMKDSDRFVQIYHRRQAYFQKPCDVGFWGTRQQMRAGKVIADWIDVSYGPLDPIFGVLLCPTAGRTGSGNDSILHGILFDQSGPVAYHSAVHDAFGYLKKKHGIGPGYNYFGMPSIFNEVNPLAGQFSGLLFWTVLLYSYRISRKNFKWGKRL